MAQPSLAGPDRDFSSYAPSVEPTRISPDQAPKIDGILDDEAWQQATVLEEFYQVEPQTGVKPTEDTIIYMMYDENALYVGIKAYDKNPSAIKTTILERDGDVWRDDMVRFYIDPYDTGVSGFGFDVNALGARADRLVQANRRPVDEWDTIWDAAGQVTDEGWQAEFTIPFRSISFDPEGSGWGLMITREITHKNEEVRWAGIDRSVNKFGFARPGRLNGIKDVNQGSGVDIELFAGVEATRSWERPRDDDVRLNPSANIYYKFTPSLTGLLAINADFSDTPLDAPEINTGQFTLFRPETRDFFLQDAAFFEFGGDALSRSPNGRPFFSRRIGLVSGAPVAIDAGLKLSGEIAGFEIGALSAMTESTAALDTQTLSVARATKSISNNSRLGFIVTNGDPTGETENSVVGVDLFHRRSNFFGGGLFEADLFLQRSFSSTAHEDSSMGARLSYPNDRWRWQLEARQVGEDFTPALGFVNRPGTNSYTANWYRRWRNTHPSLRWVEFGTDHQIVTDLDGQTRTTEHGFIGTVQTNATDEFRLGWYEAEETTVSSFALPTGITIPSGSYNQDGFEVELTPSRVRTYGLGLRYADQNFFDGTNQQIEVSAIARPSPYFNITMGYEREDISVPDGDLTVHVGTADFVVNFSPELALSTQLQYDNVSEVGAIFSRLRWEPRPQTEIFLSLGHGAFIQKDDFPRKFRSVQSSLFFRVGNRFQF